MDPKKNRTLLIVFVTIMIVGLVGVYVPLLFTSPVLAPDYSDDATVPAQTPEEVAPTSTASTSAPVVDGFSGLDQESENLGDF